MRPTVGASLLAIAVVQRTSMLNVPMPSRASSLPQDLWMTADLCLLQIPLWGGSYQLAVL
ncbi:hypothetical protein EMIT043CA1_10428 [Pseudomonas brassicacearum]